VRRAPPRCRYRPYARPGSTRGILPPSSASRVPLSMVAIAVQGVPKGPLKPHTLGGSRTLGVRCG
jgi:hypothetical protein